MKTFLSSSLALALVLGAAAAAAAPSEMTREEIQQRAKYGVGYSYWWGHGRWRTDGTSHGSCSGSCPGCSHGGSYGADCSGYVGKCWQVPSDIALTTDAHPYSTYNFYNQSTWWSKIAIGSMELGDAAVRNNGSSGHVLLFQKKGSSGKIWAYESRSCLAGVVHNERSLTSDYKGIRRDKIAAAAPPPPPDPTPEEVTVTSAVMADDTATSDVDGDGRADLCARGAAGFRCYLAATGFSTSVKTAEMSNDKGWDDPKYHSTIRMADVNGDGLADVCGRGAAGFFCWLSDGKGWPTQIDGPALGDASGWGGVDHYATIRMADVNGDGKADVCARAAAGWACWLSDGQGFPTKIAGPELSDANGWTAIQFYSTIRMADVNGDGLADVCGRANDGFHCWLSDGKGFPTAVAGPPLSDALGWSKPEYYLTIRMADINGDHRADVCARAADGLTCWLSDADGFATAVPSGVMTDEAGWSAIRFYSTLRMADVNGDGRDDICARAAVGMYCWPSTGAGFDGRITGPAWSDSSGWDDPMYYRTIRAFDYDGDGREDLCGRSKAGMRCFPSTGTGFGAELVGPELSDAQGWSGIQYYSTLRTGTHRKVLPPPTGCIPSPEVCDGLDNDCDGKIDNGINCTVSLPDAGDDDMVGDGTGDVGDVGDTGSGGTGPESVGGGCACRVGGGPGPAPALALAAGALALAAARRRRR